MPHSGEDARPVGNHGAVLFPAWLSVWARRAKAGGQIWWNYRKASAIIAAVSTDWLRRKSCSST